MYIFYDKVMPYDTDYQGIAHYASYYRFVTDALSSFAEKKLSKVMTKYRNLWFVTVESHATYKKPLYLGNKIKIVIEPEIKEKKIITNFKIFKGKELTTTGYLAQKIIDKNKWHSIEIPEEIKNVIVSR